MDAYRKVTLLLLLTMALSACGGGRPDGESAATGNWAQESAGEAEPLAVEALEASRGTLLQTVEASGTVRGGQEVEVVAEAQGVILESAFDLGQYVEAGTVLVRTDATVAQLNVEEARGTLDSARLDLAATQRRFENGSASQAELTRARSAADGAEARYEAAVKAREDHTIRAPIDGFIAGKAENLSRGNYLNRGISVARIVDLESLRMEISLGEREVQYISEGLPAEVTIPACGPLSFAARIRSIAAGSDPRTGSFPVVIEWDNACDAVRSGMSATVRVRPEEANPAIVVPSAVIRSDSGGDYVFVAAGETVERREITTGDRLGDRVQVVEGLREGDVVITSGLTAISDGSPVNATVRGRTGDLL
jgi:membrane fusion protein (multidrug efflux system)